MHECAQANICLAGITVQSAQHSTDQATAFLLHGFLGAKEDWLPYMHALASVGVSCSAVDLPGHGGSTSVAISVEAAADALASLIVQRGLSGCLLVGYSMGARLAMAVATRHPGLCGKLMLVSGTPGIKVWSSIIFLNAHCVRWSGTSHRQTCWAASLQNVTLHTLSATL